VSSFPVNDTLNFGYSKGELVHFIIKNIITFLLLMVFLEAKGNQNNDCENGDLGFGVGIGLERKNQNSVNLSFDFLSGYKTELFSIIFTDGEKSILENVLKNKSFECGKSYNFTFDYQKSNLIAIAYNNTRSNDVLIRSEEEFRKKVYNLLMLPYYSVSYLNRNFKQNSYKIDKLVEYSLNKEIDGYFYYSKEKIPSSLEMHGAIYGKDDLENIYLIVKPEEKRGINTLQCYVNGNRQLKFFNKKKFVSFTYKKNISYVIKVNFENYLNFGLNSVNCFVFNENFAETANIYPIYPLYIWKNK
jgi:hypothetical protein